MEGPSPYLRRLAVLDRPGDTELTSQFTHADREVSKRATKTFFSSIRGGVPHTGSGNRPYRAGGTEVKANAAPAMPRWSA